MNISPSRISAPSSASVAFLGLLFFCASLYTQACIDGTAAANDGLPRLALSETQRRGSPPPPPPSAVGSGDHAYFDALCARADKFACYSLRDAAKVANDTDPRRQDARKFEIPEGKSAGAGSVRLPMGAHHPNNILITFDWWMGAEFNAAYSDLDQFKLTPVIFWTNDDWFGMRTKFRHARINEQTLPAGGPYVAIPYAHGQGNSAAYVKPPYFISNTRAHRGNISLPSNVPKRQARSYGQAVAPVATDTIPGGMEFGVVAERWTRFWFFFERAPQEDWIATDSRVAGQRLEAYKWTIWGADEERDPVKILDAVVIGKRAMLDQIGQTIRLGTFSGGAAGNRNVSYAGRGPLVAYARNVAVLHGTSTADTRALLQKPVASAPKPPSVFLSATPMAVTPGATVTLRWASTQVETCTASGGWSSAKSTSGGSETVKPTVTTMYALTCTNAQGSTSKSVTVTVQ